MLDMQTNLVLKPAYNYANPKSATDLLPIVYGDLTVGGPGGQWTAKCIDTASNIFALAGHPLHSVTGLYDGDGALIDPGTYTISLSEDYQSRGLIALAAFSSQPPSRVLVLGRGKPNSDGQLIDNPLDIAVDMVVTALGSDAANHVDQVSLSRARQNALLAGLRAAGVVNSKARLGDVLTDLLGCFLGSWWTVGNGMLRLSLDLGPCLQGESELAANLRHAELENIEVSAELDDVANQAELHYCLNHASGDFQAATDGSSNAQPQSVGLYGHRSATLELPWVRDEQTALVLGQRFVTLFCSPRRTVSCQVNHLRLLHLEKGDMVTLSLPWLYDDQGLALANQIVRVLSVEPRLDGGVMGLSLLDMGLYKTIAYPADGSHQADGSTKAGSIRDRRQY